MLFINNGYDLLYYFPFVKGKTRKQGKKKKTRKKTRKKKEKTKRKNTLT